ncbi:MAG: c-type cytochrome [Gammaproteobacteria bacterium]|nr:c-type cytochrome [Gammaproteobacteria bacterium]
MALHDDRTFIRHFSWVILFLAAMLIVFIFLSFLIVGVTGVEDHSGYTYVQYMNQHPAEVAPAGSAPVSSEAQEAIPPVAAATLNVAAAGNAQSGSSTGEGAGAAINGDKIWHAHCAACHATGVMGAPRIGDNDAWAPILAKYDLATLYKHAIEGFGAMPPKGGALSLSDAQVEAAVRYMLKQSGWQGG